MTRSSIRLVLSISTQSAKIIFGWSLAGEPSCRVRRPTIVLLSNRIENVAWLGDHGRELTLGASRTQHGLASGRACAKLPNRMRTMRMIIATAVAMETVSLSHRLKRMAPTSETHAEQMLLHRGDERQPNNHVKRRES